MVEIITKIFLFLLPLQQTHQRTLLRHPRMQKMRNHHTQNMQVSHPLTQIHQTQETRLQVHRRQEQRHQNIPPVETVQLHRQCQVLSLLLDMQWDRKLHLPMVRQTQTQ